MNNPESGLKNETHKILWYFEMQIDLIAARIQTNDNNNNNNKTCQIVDFPSKEITEWKSKKTKREISIKTFPEN